MSLIARLIEAGTPADLIEEVALLVAEKRAADARRAKDAARKREERGAASTDIQGQRGQDGTATSVDADLIEGFTPVSPKGDTAPKGAKRDRGGKIPDDWKPPAVAELGPEFRPLAEQWTSDSYRTEAAAFRSYWLGESGAKACKSNWKRAWENRIAQIHGKVMRDQRSAGAGWGTGPPAGPTLVDRILSKAAP